MRQLSWEDAKFCVEMAEGMERADKADMLAIAVAVLVYVLNRIAGHDEVMLARVSTQIGAMIPVMAEDLRVYTEQHGETMQ